MRISDRLYTETPRPCLDDAPYTKFADMYPNAVVIDATDAHSLFMEMEHETPEALAYADHLGGSTTAHQVSQFMHFDWSVVGNVAPPFENFVIEMDVRESLIRMAKNLGYEPHPAHLVDIGQTAVAFGAFTRERWEEGIIPRLLAKGYDPFGKEGSDVSDALSVPWRWVYVITTYVVEPGKGLFGPAATYVIPVDDEGHLFTEKYRDEPGHRLRAVTMGPRGYEADSMKYALVQGFTSLIPAMLALSFLNTPRSTKEREGYHILEEREPPKNRQARKYLERNFRPLTKWKTLDITPLRSALREAHGGSMPTDWQALTKALHIVRGHTATYMPNTYFGRKHPDPITVFRPSYRRGDIKAGVVHKEYALHSGEESS